jgi:hypothetical protein
MSKSGTFLALLLASPAAFSQSVGTIAGDATHPARSVRCPSPTAVGFLRHEIAYERTEETNPLGRVSFLRMRIWERGPLAVFYVDEGLRTFPSSVRLAYVVGAYGARGSATCPADQNWQRCAETIVGLEAANHLVRTCMAILDLRSIPGWEPSPDDQTKRQVAAELRIEIETKWQGVQQIVVRDFNLKDRQITMYLKMLDGDYFQGCGFYAARQPHCEGWHLFGQAPLSSIREWIFEKPYRLK